MKSAIRRSFVILGVLVFLVWCVPSAGASQHAKPRSGGASRQPHSSGQGQHARPANPQQHRGSGGQHAVPRNSDRYRGRYDAYRYRNGGSRSYGYRRFPRSYGFNYFYGYRYHGMWFRPNYRYWNGYGYFYWPWYDAPLYGCGWYWLPTHCQPDSPPDGDEGEEGWGYDDWGWVYVCVD